MTTTEPRLSCKPSCPELQHPQQLCCRTGAHTLLGQPVPAWSLSPVLSQRVGNACCTSWLPMVCCCGCEHRRLHLNLCRALDSVPCTERKKIQCPQKLSSPLLSVVTKQNLFLTSSNKGTTVRDGEQAKSWPYPATHKSMICVFFWDRQNLKAIFAMSQDSSLGPTDAHK